jgi:acyl carrier protein
MNEAEIREQLRGWILEHCKEPPVQGMTDETPILEAGLLSSLQVVEFILFIESLRGDEIDLDSLEPEVLTNLDTVYAAFFKPQP